MTHNEIVDPKPRSNDRTNNETWYILQQKRLGLLIALSCITIIININGGIAGLGMYIWSKCCSIWFGSNVEASSEK